MNWLPDDFKIYINIPLVKEDPFSITITITIIEMNVYQVVIKGDYLKTRC